MTQYAASEAIAGYEGKAYISTDGGVTLVEFAQLRKYELTVQRDMLDAGTHSSAALGWKRKKPGMAEFTGTLSLLLATSDASEDAVYDALNGATPVFLAFDPQGTEAGKPRRSGMAYLKDVKEGSPYNELATYDCTVEGDGPLTNGVVGAVAVTVTAASPTVVHGNTHTDQMTAVVSNTQNQAVTWTVTGGNNNGTIDANGLFTAPAAVPSPATVTVVATSVKDNTKTGSVTITIT